LIIGAIAELIDHDGIEAHMPLIVKFQFRCGPAGERPGRPGRLDRLIFDIITLLAGPVAAPPLIAKGQMQPNDVLDDRLVMESKVMRSRHGRNLAQGTLSPRFLFLHVTRSRSSCRLGCPSQDLPRSNEPPSLWLS
jgi:hypothetical protein